MSSLVLAVALALVPQDTTRPVPLDPIVVTAERVPTPLSRTAAAVTRLPASELARLPRLTLADLLSLVPGFAVVSFDGLGFDPQVMARGFYGGGEAEYVLVQIDGHPVNQVMNGVVAWDALPPLASVEAIEVVRGGASALYGDAAIGGVINVITRRGATAARTEIETSWASHRTTRGAVDVAAASLGGLRVNAGFDATAGYRRHADRESFRASAMLPLWRQDHSRAELTIQGHLRGLDEPGPLLESLLAAGRRSSDALFRFDHTRDKGIGGRLTAERRVGSRVTLSGAGGFEARRIEAVRTLALAPGFGDTQERQATTTLVSLGASAEVRRLGWGDLLAGVDASHASLDSEYYLVAGGSRDDYAAADGERGARNAMGEGSRSRGAGYVQYQLQPLPRLRVSAGARLDLIQDAFASDRFGPAGGSTHSALSPRMAVNLGYLDRPGSSGNGYLAWSRSFKAATLDQKFDLRLIPIPFPPFEVTTSNPELSPQKGSTLEAGLYHRLAIGGSGAAHLTVSGYDTRMTNELDFDVESFRYVNIGKSRHRGLEAGVRIEGRRWSGTAGYALQDAVSRQGEHSGKRLKAIPRHSWQGGVSVRPLRREEALDAWIGATRLGGMFLDDGNTRPIPGYTRVDARLALRIRAYTVSAGARNLFATTYSSTGFLDPAGTGEAYWYPAAGRVLELGIRAAW